MLLLFTQPLKIQATKTRTMPTEIIVTGCWDCPMYSVEDGYNYCKMQKVYELFMSQLFCLCPLLDDSITIKLKNNDTHKTDVRGGESEG